MAGQVRHTTHIPEWKVKEVEELVDKISKSRVVGVVGLRELPADNLQKIRGDLRGNVEIRMVRNTIARRALEPRPLKSGLWPILLRIRQRSFSAI